MAARMATAKATSLCSGRGGFFCRHVTTTTPTKAKGLRRRDVDTMASASSSSSSSSSSSEEDNNSKAIKKETTTETETETETEAKKDQQPGSPRRNHYFMNLSTCGCLGNLLFFSIFLFTTFGFLLAGFIEPTDFLPLGGYF